ncbi:MAG: RNA polymerase subunit sigma-70, partial [Clostridia bacterium]|nr:RNA polymerase subunit sigma-70 [Clostridia bacterium]
MLSILLWGWLGYLSSFPQPLTEAEENALLERLQQGDLAARSRLAEHNLRLVAHIVHKFHLPPDKTDDLISVGSIGLLK